MEMVRRGSSLDKTINKKMISSDEANNDETVVRIEAIADTTNEALLR